MPRGRRQQAIHRRAHHDRPRGDSGWLERHNLPADTWLADLARNAELRAEIAEAVDEANSKVSKAEAIKKFEILDTDFTIESGELTPTMKLKRNVISDTYKQAIATCTPEHRAPTRGLPGDAREAPRRCVAPMTDL